MNLLEALLAKPFFEALGWALVHFVWQGAMVAALYAGARILLRRASSNARYGAACAAMLLMLILPVATLIAVYPDSAGQTLSYSASMMGEGSQARAAETPSMSDLSGALWQHPAYSSPAEVPTSPSTYESLKRWAEDSFNAALPWLVALWFAGVFFFSIRFLGGLVLVQRLKKARTSPAVQIWEERLAALCKQLRVSRPVRLCESALVEVPTVIGWLRPVILVPASVFTGLSAPQLEALLAHELAHIRRYDYLVNLIQTAVEALLFYHPAVWWVSSQVRQEREHCCDDLAVAVCSDVLVYARALAALEHLRSRVPRPAMAATGGSVLKRIQRLVGSTAPLSHGFDSWLAGLIAIATAFSILAGSQSSLLSTGAVSLADELFSTSETAQKAEVAASSPGADSNRKSEKVEEPSIEEDETPSQDDSDIASSGSDDDQASGSFEAADQDRGSGGEDFIGELIAEGYTNLSVDQLIALRRHGVTAEFARGMKASFGTMVPIDHLVALKVHGATPQFIRDVREAGLDKLSTEHAVAFRVHGVTPQFIREVKAGGFTDLSAEKLVAFRVHNVTPEFAQELKSLGFNPSGEELIALRVHGATSEYVRTMKAQIRDSLTLEEVIAFRVHGISPEYVKGLEGAGYRDLSANEIVAFKIHGVSEQFIKAMRSLGFDRIDAGELVALRVHGVTPEFVEQVKNRGFKDVTVGQLIELKRLNIIPSSRRN